MIDHLVDGVGELPPAEFVHAAPGQTGTALDSIVACGVIESGSGVCSSITGGGVYLHSYTTEGPDDRAARRQ